MIYSEELLWVFVVFLLAAWFALRYLVVIRTQMLTLVFVAIVALFTLPYLPMVIAQNTMMGIFFAAIAVYGVKTLLKTDWLQSAALLLVLYVGTGAALGFV